MMVIAMIVKLVAMVIMTLMMKRVMTLTIMATKMVLELTESNKNLPDETRTIMMLTSNMMLTLSMLKRMITTYTDVDADDIKHEKEGND